MYLEFFLLLPECEAGREWLVRLNGLDHPSFLEPHPYLAFQTDSAIPKMIQICIVIHNYLFLSKSDFRHNYNTYWGFPGGASGKNQPASVRDAKKPGFDPYVGKIPWRRKMATHSSILAWTVPQTRGAWRATVHRVTKSWTQLSDI